MLYRYNLGCLWLLLLILLLGGTPLLVGLLRVFAGLLLIGAVGGALLAWWIRRHAVLEYRRARTARGVRFVELLVELLVRLAEADGELDRREVTAIRRFFQDQLGYRGEQLLWVRDLIKASRRSWRPLESICAEIATEYGLQERFLILQVLARVAQADGVVRAAEAQFIERVAILLGLQPYLAGFEFEGPSQAATDRRIDEALATLGLSRGASPEEIKQAWRKLSLENHPDRVTHLGPEFRRLAEERMRRINAAYDVLKEAGMAA
ncbi:MAG: hypothetical protein D6815_08815 [Candidatus Dadabacteria bacterium]|nr:MAG: hypothetical protein D6815_08815 [Candidatus Dadabacteria bacterium]